METTADLAGTFRLPTTLPVVKAQAGTHARRSAGVRSRLGCDKAKRHESSTKKSQRGGACNRRKRRAVDGRVLSVCGGCVQRAVLAAQTAAIWIFSAARCRSGPSRRVDAGDLSCGTSRVV